MKKNNTEIEKFRDIELEKMLAGCIGNGTNGIFRIPCKNVILTVVASDGCDYDHVSVSLPDRIPTWDEMCFIKNIFFEDEEIALQYHPAKSKYINEYEFCLHLWRPQKENIPMPNIFMV